MSEENKNVRCDLYRKIFNSAIEKSVNLQEETKLIKKGYLIPAKDGRHKVKKTINGSRSGLMRFDRKKFENNK